MFAARKTLRARQLPGTRLLAFVLSVIAVIDVHADSLKTAFDDDGTITVNGERTFIIGTYQYTTFDRDPNLAENMRELANAGFNLVRVGASDHAAAGTAAEHGLMVWTEAGTIDLGAPETSEESLKKHVEAALLLPGIAFLETVDEPAWTWMKAEPRVRAEALVRAYPIIKEAAPDLLVYTNHAPTNLEKTLRAYNDGTDIVAVDIYPVNPGGLKHTYALFEDGLQGDLNNVFLSQVGEYAQKMRRVAGPGRPVFMVLQAFAWEMLLDEQERRPEKILYPSYADQRFMAYSAFIEGAAGVVYWGSHYTPKPSQAWDDLKRVTREMAALKGPLAARAVDAGIAIEYHEIGHSVDDGIQIRSVDFDDARFVFTCNADRYPCKATLAGFNEWKRCEVVDEGRSTELTGGAITDTWEAFDVHIYRFTR